MALPEPTIGVTLLNANTIGLYVKNGDGKEERLGLVQSVSWDEDYKVTPYDVLGFWGHAGFTSLGYSLSLRIGLFVPDEKPSKLPDGGTRSALDLEWTREKAQASGKPLVCDNLILKRIKDGVIVDHFKNCMLASHGGQIAAGQQVMRNLQFMCVSRTNPNGKA